MEAEEIEILLKLREGIRNGSWEEVVDAWNEISGESLLPPDTRTPAEKLQRQIQEKLLQEQVPEKVKSKSSGPIDPDTMEESIKDSDIVKIDPATDDNKEKKNRRVDVKKRSSGVPDDMRADSEKGKDKPARFHDSIPDHIARGSDS